MHFLWSFTPQTSVKPRQNKTYKENNEIVKLATIQENSHATLDNFCVFYKLVIILIIIKHTEWFMFKQNMLFELRKFRWFFKAYKASHF